MAYFLSKLLPSRFAARSQPDPANCWLDRTLSLARFQSPAVAVGLSPESGVPIRAFNIGQIRRDFTYIDDIAEGVLRCCNKPAIANAYFDSLALEPATSAATHREFNTATASPRPISLFELMEEALGREALKDFQPMQQPGDLVATAAEADALEH